MAVANRDYYYDDYRRGSMYRTPPLNTAELLYERNDGGSYAYAVPQPAEPVIRPFVVPQPSKTIPGRRSGRHREPSAHRFRYPYISGKEKAFIFVMIFVFSAIFMAIILFSSYHAYMQNEVNKTRAQTAQVQEDIDGLKVAIEKGNNIDIIEQTAVQELGMKYPEAKQIVYLDDVGAAGDDQG